MIEALFHKLGKADEESGWMHTDCETLVISHEAALEG